MGLPQEGQGIKSMTRDMTVGNPVKLIVSFSIPLLIGNLFQQLYSMVDAVIVGQFLGVDALAAVGTTGPLSFLILGFVMGMTGGFSVLVAQRFGAGDYDGMRHTVAMSVLLSVVLCIVMTALSVAVCRPLLVAMNTADNIIDMAYDYIIVIFAGTFANILYNLLSGILRALGDSRTPLYFLILSSLLNVVLDIFCVVNLQMGVAGAGYATVLSQFISGLLCLLYMMKKFPILHLQKKDWVFRRATCLHMLKVGAPMAFQFSHHGDRRHHAAGRREQLRLLCDGRLYGGQQGWKHSRSSSCPRSPPPRPHSWAKTWAPGKCTASARVCAVAARSRTSAPWS